MRGQSAVKIRGKHLFLLFIFSILSSGPVAADDEPAQLSEAEIRDFIQETNDVTNGGTSERPVEDIVAFLNTHLHKDARFKSKMVYNIPGYPPKETELALNKQEFIDNVQSGAKTVQDYEHSITVKSVQISSDKRKATVLTNGREEGTMPVQDGNGGSQDVPITGYSTCHQIIMLSDQNVIQMFNANCNTEITFEDF